MAGLSLSADLADGLAIYFELLARWNRKINLTGSNLDVPSAETLDRLLIEPLLAARHIAHPRNLIDLGSGGGSPAIPMALACGRPQTTMVESRTRKAVFLQEAIRELGLSGSRVLAVRFESLIADADLIDAHDVVSIRAVRLDALTLRVAKALARPGGAVALFRSEEWDPAAGVDGLAFERSHLLLENLNSRLIILTKPG